MADGFSITKSLYLVTGFFNTYFAWFVTKVNFHNLIFFVFKITPCCVISKFTSRDFEEKNWVSLNRSEWSSCLTICQMLLFLTKPYVESEKTLEMIAKRFFSSLFKKINLVFN